jgi:4-amino-4-deoxy-L-arabinose transferase-like glycosyltransferase
LNQILLILTAALVFGLGLRHFDNRVAWVALISFVATELVWAFSLTGLSTSLLMFLVTAVIFCALEIYSVGEACFESTETSFLPAWGWAILLGLLLAAACLTRFSLPVPIYSSSSSSSSSPSAPSSPGSGTCTKSPETPSDPPSPP